MLSTLETFLLAAFFGISIVLFTTAVVLAILHYYRIIPHIHNNQHDHQPTIDHVIPQRPPSIHLRSPILPSRRAPTLDEHPRFLNRGNEEDVPREVEVSIQEGSNGSVTRARPYFVQISTNNFSIHSSAGHTLHPA